MQLVRGSVGRLLTEKLRGGGVYTCNVQHNMINWPLPMSGNIASLCFGAPISNSAAIVLISGSKFMKQRPQSLQFCSLVRWIDKASWQPQLVLVSSAQTRRGTCCEASIRCLTRFSSIDWLLIAVISKEESRQINSYLFPLHRPDNAKPFSYVIPSGTTPRCLLAMACRRISAAACPDHLLSCYLFCYLQATGSMKRMAPSSSSSPSP